METKSKLFLTSGIVEFMLQNNFKINSIQYFFIYILRQVNSIVLTS